jgi:K+-transporting ATPase KdpF subunit
VEVSPMLLVVLLIVAVLLVAYLLYALVNPEAFQ